jgi:integrase
MSRKKTMLRKVDEYVTHRRNLGYDLEVAAGELRRFARYAESIGHHGPLTTEIALRWARQAADRSPIYQARRIEMVRPFAKYLAAFEPGTQIPPRRLLGPAHRRIQPHIYNSREVLRLIDAAGQLTPHGGLRPATYRTLLGLLASTGLRTCEALKLNRADVDLVNDLLTVRETKFHKSRLVPLHRSATRALAAYANIRDAHLPRSQSDRFLLSERGTPLLPSVVHYTFQKLRAVIAPECPGRRPPRLYDLRHTFACRRLLQWYREGVNVHHRLLHLSTYLGHVKVSDTYWYLSGIPELLSIAAERFQSFSDGSRGDPR